MIRTNLDRILEKGLTILLIIMVTNVLWQVASRYILGNPSVFTDELARYLLIWIGLIGAAYGSGKNTHVAIDLLKKNLNPKQQYIQTIIINIIVAFFSVLVLIVGGIRLVLLSFELGQTSSAIQLPIGYVYLALPISGSLITFYAIDNLIQHKK